MNIIAEAGSLALGSRLRILSDRFTNEAHEIYKYYGVDFRPNWFPVFYALVNAPGSLSIMNIANQTGQSHPSVIKIIKAMKVDGWIEESKDMKDGRKNNISLSTKGRKLITQIQEQFIDVQRAAEDLLSGVRHNLLLAIEEAEFHLNQKSLIQRVKEQRKNRISGEVEVTDLCENDIAAFKALNVEWISKYFIMEEEDYKALDSPFEKIINPGGAVLMAYLNGEAVGCCGLLKMDSEQFDFELVKMAVAPSAQGKGIGYIIGKAALERAKMLGASKVYLETNTLLESAIGLYQKLGFNQIMGVDSPYQRCNFQMKIDI